MTTARIDDGFQLTPTKNEVCLIIDSLFGFYSLHGIEAPLGSCIRPLPLKTVIYLQIDSFNVWKRTHDQGTSAIKHCCKRTVTKPLQFTPVNESGNVPIRRSEVLRSIDYEVVIVAAEEIQSPIFADYP
jgi:hypothetical protein